MRRCPICRCEIESHCPRYNQNNFEKLKGPLQPITVSNHEDPSRMVPAAPTSSGNAAMAATSNTGSSHVRMTIRMPYPTSQLFETASSTRAPAAVDAVPRPPSRYVRPSALRQPTNSRQAQAASSAHPSPARVRFAPSADSLERSSEALPAKRRRFTDSTAVALDETAAAAQSTRRPRRAGRTQRAHTVTDTAPEAKEEPIEAEDHSPIASRTRTRRQRE